MNILKLKLHYINKTSAVLLADRTKNSSRLISNPVNTLKISQDTVIGRRLNLFLFQTLIYSVSKACAAVFVHMLLAQLVRWVSGAVGFRRQIVVAVHLVKMALTASFVEPKYMLFPKMCLVIPCQIVQLIHLNSLASKNIVVLTLSLKHTLQKYVL